MTSEAIKETCEGCFWDRHKGTCDSELTGMKDECINNNYQFHFEPMLTESCKDCMYIHKEECPYRDSPIMLCDKFTSWDIDCMGR